MSSFFSNFHLIRPWYLLLLLPAAAGLIGLGRKKTTREQIGKIIAPHLLRHLIVGKDEEEVRKFKPVHILALIWLLSILAICGPTWKQKPSPFEKDGGRIVIALQVTPSMLERDIQPSRLERATQKIQDFLKMNEGKTIALIGFSGTAHLVMPFTEDGNVIDMFSRELSPEIMPVEGNDPVRALELSKDLLAPSQSMGSVVMITDRIDSEMTQTISRFVSESRIPVHSYLVAPKKVPSNQRNLVTRVTPDDDDLKRLSSKVASSISKAVEGSNNEWEDSGYWLLWLIVPLACLWFIPRWSVVYD